MSSLNRTTSIKTDGLEVSFGTSPFSILRIVNRYTGQVLCIDGKQSILLRTPLKVSEPIFLNRLQSFKFSEGKIHFFLTDRTGKYKLHAILSQSGSDISFNLEATAQEPIWMIEWQLSGLRLKEVIIPALGGQSISEQMPIGNVLSYKYPFWWNAQFVIGKMNKGGIWMYTRNVRPDFIMLRVKREKDGFALTYGFEATAPLTSSKLKATWYLSAFNGSWKVPVDIHREWMEKAFSLIHINENPAAPEWMKDIRFVLELWGMRKDQPQPHHTFEQMKKRIIEWKKLYPPENTLLYIVGFANQGIDSEAPNYDPSEYLGGAKKFKELIDIAHRLKYRVMIHTNVLAMTFTHRLYPAFKKYQVDDAFGRPMTWGLDMDGDWLSEPYFAYINPGVKAWSELIIDILRKLIDRYNFDGVFIDQTLLAFNNSRGQNFLTGMRDHIKRLHDAFPNILFSGEGLHEQVVGQLPMAQIHGIDSITEVHGIEGRVKWRFIHPVSIYLFNKYTRFVPHLLTRHPSHSMFEFQEKSYEKLGIMPALCLYDADQPINTHAVRNMIARARKLSNNNI